MEKETKRCPYCGEEILTVAKKCKHCGEWLEEVASVSEKIEKDTISKLQLVKEKGVSVEDTPNDESIEVNQENKNGDSNINIPLWATIFFWIAIFGAFASWLQECGIDHGGHGKWELFIDIANWIPYWLTLVFSWIGEAGLVFLLMNMTKRLGKSIGFLGISLMILLAVVAYFEYIEFFYFIDEDLEIFQLIITLVLLVCYVVIGIILIHNYTNALKGLGMVFIIYPTLIILFVLTSNIFSSQTESVIETALLGEFFITVVYLYLFHDILKDTFNDPKNSSSSSMIMVGSLVAAAIAAGLLSMCDSDKSSLNSSNSTDVENNMVADNNEISDSEVTTPNGTMSAKTFLEFDNLVSCSMDVKITELLAECGYEYIGKNEDDCLYYSKNCKLIRSEYGYEPTSITENSSYIEFSKGEHPILWAFSENCFKSWCKDLESLGYKGEGPNKGNQGQDWGYVKNGEYTVYIWNDYENTYYIQVME